MPHFPPPSPELETPPRPTPHYSRSEILSKGRPSHSPSEEIPRILWKTTKVIHRLMLALLPCHLERSRAESPGAVKDPLHSWHDHQLKRSSHYPVGVEGVRHHVERGHRQRLAIPGRARLQSCRKPPENGTKSRSDAIRSPRACPELCRRDVNPGLSGKRMEPVPEGRQTIAQDVSPGSVRREWNQVPEGRQKRPRRC